MADTIQRFLFEHAPVRGEIVHLDATWRAVLERHDYPPAVRALLGEMMAAAALLTATLKFGGTLIMQIQGNGPIKLLVVECTSGHHMRATAKWSQVPATGNLLELVGDGKFAITLDPGQGRSGYQGVVPLEGETVAAALEQYMLRSEQIETRLWLTADNTRAAGLLLQKLPDREGADADAWQRATVLAASLTAPELTALDTAELLRRLYSAEDVRVFKARPVEFRCTCSRERVTAMLHMLGRGEVDSIVAERGEVEVNCEFCNQRYRFDADAAAAVFAGGAQAPVQATRH
ncbi:MAG: Hsp33 family molecular chaperone HslO [Burkholderiales bacterium]